jgi:tetratricopeptide (TPR) repeat protein
MKLKSILILGCVLICFKAFSQNSNVQSAENNLNDGKLTLAQKSIDLAAADDNTSQKPKTWYVRGVIYQTIAEDTVKPGPLEDYDAAVQSYEKATLLDTKKDYTDKMIIDLARLRIDYYNMGIKLEQAPKNDYAGAHQDFLKALSVSNFLHANYAVKALDTLSMFNVAYSSLMNKNYDSAKILFQQLSGFTYNSTQTYSTMPHNVYISLINAEYGLKDTADAETTIKKARQILPNDEAFLIDEVNIALGHKKYDEAINGIQQAIKFEPNNPGFYYFLGNCYRDKDDATDAEPAFKKAIELKPDYADAYFSLGVLYYNEGVKIDKQRQTLALGDKNYDALGKQSDAFYQEAIPEFEKANQIAPTDGQTLNALVKVYTRTNQTDKAAATQKQLDALGK